MTRPDLDALAALLDKATPGPWATNGGRVECRDDHGWVNDGWIIGDLDGPDAEANSALIVAAVNALPALIAYVRELERERDDAAIAMRERCAQACESERVDAVASGADEDRVYNAACDHCAAAIRQRAEGLK